jgi:hypothetical protein
VTTVTASVQTGYRVVVSVSGLSSETPAVDRVTLWRDDLDRPRSEVRGYVDYEPTADGFVAVDFEVPLSRPVFYVLEVIHEDETRSEHLATAIVVEGTRPLVSVPITGEYVEVDAIETWSELARDGRATVVDVHDRPDPIVVSSGLTSPVSAPTLRTDTLTARRTLRRLLETAQVLLLRAPELDVEDAYIVTGKHTESRVSNSGLDLRRRHALDVRHVAPPSLFLPAEGDTLAELADAFPGTLADLAAAFPGTLLDIASADLEAV